MSGFPGLPFRSVDPFHLSQTPVFPAASLSPLPPGLSGYPTGFLNSSRSFYDPILPLSPRISSPALPVGFSRAEISYANSLLDPRNQLLRSPNYYLSPNASPLTFDQINSQKDKEVTSLAYEARFRSSTDLGSLSRLSAFAPEPHYKSFTGADKSRLGFPLSPVLDKETKDSSRCHGFLSPKLKSDIGERKDLKLENQEKKEKTKLWKPFETDSPGRTGDKKSKLEGISENTSHRNNNSGEVCSKSDFGGECVQVVSNSFSKKEHYPARPIPHYPSGIPKSSISDKSTSFTTFQPWKNHTSDSVVAEPKVINDSIGNTCSTVHHKVNNCLSDLGQGQNTLEVEKERKKIICENSLPINIVSNATHKEETVCSDKFERSAEIEIVSDSRSVHFINTVSSSGSTEEDSGKLSVVFDQNVTNNSTVDVTQQNKFETIENTDCVPKVGADVPEVNLPVRDIKSEKGEVIERNLDTTSGEVNIDNICTQESNEEVNAVVHEDRVELKNDKVESENRLRKNNIVDATEVTDELDEDKLKAKSIGKQRRISEVCASLFSLSHHSDNSSSAECTKTTDINPPVDNHSAINKSSSSETCKKKRRNSSIDKHPDLIDKVPNTRLVKEAGYKTDYNFNQIDFEQKVSVMSGSCVQGYNPPSSCQSSMRPPYIYNDNAVNYPSSMAGKNNQLFQDGLVQENAKTLPNHDAKQSVVDFKLSKSCKSVTDISQDSSQSDSFHLRLSSQNEYKGSLHDNGSKYSPVRAPSSSGTGPLSFGIFNTDSNSDSNFATSVSNVETSSTEAEANVETETEPPFKWDYLHSKQFVDVIYKNQGCEFSGVVKSDLESLRDSDSPKTFLDLDTVTKLKPKTNVSRSQGLGTVDNMYSSMSDNQNFQRRQTSSPYYNQNTKGNSYDSQWGPQRANQNEYMSGDSGATGKGDGFGTNQSNQNYGTDYQKFGQNSPSNGVSQYDSSKGYQSQYNNQPNSGSSYYMSNHQHSQDNYHSNSYNENSQYYDPNQSSNQQYSAGQGYSNSYQNMNQQYGNSGYRSHSTSQNSGTPFQPNSHSPSSNQSYLPSNIESPEIDAAGTPVKKQYKKRGRKRKSEKEHELNEQALHRPNTIVQVSTNVGPLIHSENSTESVDSYDYLNNPIETIFDHTYDESIPPVANQFLQIEQELCQRLLPLKYGHPVNVIYNPLVYAFQTHRDFVRKYCTSQRPILFLGMNPGPYGMSQNGVPFGEVTVVKEWLKVCGAVFKPEAEHPKKPVLGLTCTRIEVSGARFWGLFQRICKVPENFFRNCWVHNFCPQAYLSESGKNITPPQLAINEIEPINKACDAALVELVRLLNSRIIIAVGKYVQTRASKALHNAGIRNVTVECILHPSPINPHANKGWEQIVAKQLIEIGVMQYLNTDREEVQRHIEDWERAAMAAANAKLPEKDRDTEYP